MERSSIYSLLIAIALLAVWESACRSFDVPDFILPTPSRIATVAVVQASILLPHAGITALEVLIGIMISLMVAVPLSIVMFAHPSVENALAPFLVASQAVPVFAIAPLLVVWLGYGIASKVLMAAIIIFFPITVNLLEGLKSCDHEYRKLFQLMGAGFWKTLRLLYWPWALPHFFAGLKVGVSVATIGAVIGEWVGAQQGLGYLMIQANARLNVDMVFAAILWLSGMGLSLWVFVGFLERKVITWK
ncbi:Hydroxymethylpyrimidine ABC transporter, transmembrane component [Olavius sp. associated proteobacterium Delta 1]|nr:Hydroxymethylpyrimidine ABC transporter, transmembrane component [Olavius sp. associated proteobacterium Delta 1]